MRILFLGTGTSHGVPTIDCMIAGNAGCQKNVCRLSGTDPKHARTRSSLFVEWDGVHFLFDVSLDFRQQMLRENIKRIDAVFVTHRHADHIGGMPDIRSYSRLMENDLPLFGSEESVAAIRETFRYMFDPGIFEGGGIPKIEAHAISGPVVFSGKTIVPLPVDHGDLKGCFGYRLGPLVYIPDLKNMPETTFELCRGAKVLVLNCLRVSREHCSHLILEESMALARRIAPEQCCFIHLCHDIHYEKDAGCLDEWMRFSFDGMEVDCE